MKLLTAKKGKPHFTSMHFRAMLEAICGDGSYIAENYEKLETELSTNNVVKIRSGMLIHHGGLYLVEPGTYDEVSYINGTQGVKRIDLVVARYTQNAETGIEDGEWVVIQGTPAESDPVAPEYTVGNMQEGDLVDDCPVFEIHLDGITVTEVKCLLNVVPSIQGVRSNTPNPNLLINGDFQVWQRGTSFSGNSYTADRWLVQNDSDGSVVRNYLSENVSEMGVNLCCASEACYIKQIVEVSKQQKNMLLAQGAAVSFELTNNTEANSTIYFGIGASRQKYTLTNTGMHKIQGTFSLSESDFTECRNGAEEVVYLLDCVLVEYRNSDVDLKIGLHWAKLEPGEYVTPFVSKPYAEELLACQRYYYILPYAQYIMSCGATGNFYLHSEWVSNHMRPAKTVTIEGIAAMVVCYDNKQEQADITGVSYAYNAIQINTNLAVSYGTYYTYFNSESAKICVDAEIY